MVRRRSGSPGEHPPRRRSLGPHPPGPPPVRTVADVQDRLPARRCTRSRRKATMKMASVSFHFARLLFLFGLTVLSSFAVTVAFGQGLLPRNIALASGLMIGLSVGADGVGATLSGSRATGGWGGRPPRRGLRPPAGAGGPRPRRVDLGRDAGRGSPRLVERWRFRAAAGGAPMRPARRRPYGKGRPRAVRGGSAARNRAGPRPRAPTRFSAPCPSGTEVRAPGRTPSPVRPRSWRPSGRRRSCRCRCGCL